MGLEFPPKVISLKSKKPLDREAEQDSSVQETKTDPELIKKLEEFLEHAKTNTITSFVVVGCGGEDGYMLQSAMVDVDIDGVLMVGALSIVKDQLSYEVREQNMLQQEDILDD